MADAIKYGSVDIPSVPEDEPVFVLRAQDVLALPLISEYRKLCMGAGCDIHHLDAIDTVYIAVRKWQQDSGQAIKVPDSPPAARNTIPMFQRTDR